MISLPLVSIVLLANCLATVTAAGFSLTGTPVTVTPVETVKLQLSFDYQESVRTDDYSKVHNATIKYDVSTYNHSNN